MPAVVPAFTQQAVCAHTGGGGAFTLSIANSQYYTAFVFQVYGFTNGTQLTLQACLDGTTWSPLDATCYRISQPHVTAAAGLVFTVDLLAPASGGLRISSTASAADGKVFVRMSRSPYNTTRGTMVTL